MKQAILLLALFLSLSVFSQTISADSLNKLFDAAYFNCGNANGDSIKGIQLATQYLAIDSTSGDAYNNRGLGYQRCKNYKAALADFKKAISLKKDDYIPIYNLGLTYYYMDDFKLAVSYFDTALSYNPNHARSYYFKAVSVSKLNDNATAITCFNKAIQLDSTRYKFYMDRAIVYSELKKYPLAIQDYKTAIKLNPAAYELYFGMAMALLHNNQPNAAIEQLNKAKKLTTHPMIDFAMGLAYTLKENKTEACKCFKTAIDKKLPEAQDAYDEFCKSYTAPLHSSTPKK